MCTEQDNYDDERTNENHASRIFIALLLCVIAGATLGYTVGVGHGERNAVIACWKR